MAIPDRRRVSRRWLILGAKKKKINRWATVMGDRMVTMVLEVEATEIAAVVAVATSRCAKEEEVTEAAEEEAVEVGEISSQEMVVRDRKGMIEVATQKNQSSNSTPTPTLESTIKMTRGFMSM